MKRKNRGNAKKKEKANQKEARRGSVINGIERKTKETLPIEIRAKRVKKQLEEQYFEFSFTTENF